MFTLDFEIRLWEQEEVGLRKWVAVLDAPRRRAHTPSSIIVCYSYILRCIISVGDVSITNQWSRAIL